MSAAKARQRKTLSSEASPRAVSTSLYEFQQEAENVSEIDKQNCQGLIQRGTPDLLLEIVIRDTLIASPLTAAWMVPPSEC